MAIYQCKGLIHKYLILYLFESWQIYWYSQHFVFLILNQTKAVTEKILMDLMDNFYYKKSCLICKYTTVLKVDIVFAMPKRNRLFLLVTIVTPRSLLWRSSASNYWILESIPFTAAASDLTTVKITDCNKWKNFNRLSWFNRW